MNQAKEAFILPTILVTGTILLIILAFSLQTISTNRHVLFDQRAEILAKQAVESGQAKAKACIEANDKRMTWTTAKPLKVNTDCFGNEITGRSKYVLKNGNIRTYYTIYPINDQDNFKDTSGEGVTEIIKKEKDGTVRIVKKYKHTLSSYIHTGLTFDDVAFGSLYVGNGVNDLYKREGSNAHGRFMKAVYFFTKTSGGTISSVGYNIDGALTGYNSNTAIPWANRLISNPKEFYISPYHLAKPIAFNIPIKSTTIDFQGNGWNAFFLGNDGRTIYSTGSNINYDLGLTDSYHYLERPIWSSGQAKMDLTNIPIDEKVEKIYSNGGTYLLTDKGKLYGTGVVHLSPGFGNEINVNNSYFHRKNAVTRPVRIKGPKSFNNNRIISFYTDSHYNGDKLAVAVNEKGQLFYWGEYKHDSRRDTPQLIGGLPKMKSAVTDGGTIWALSRNGEVYAAGRNHYGQLGQGHNTDTRISYFRKVNFPTGVKIKKIAADGYSALFLSASGDVYGVGLNNRGQLGHPLKDKKKNLACWYNHNDFTLPYEQDGTLKCNGKQWRRHWWFTGYYWKETASNCSCYVPGSGDEYLNKPQKYQLNGEKAKDIFITSQAIKGNVKDYEIEADYHRNSYIVTTKGEVYGAGSNHYGQLGVGADGDNTDGYGGIPKAYNLPQKMKLDNKNSDSSVVGGEDKKVVVKQVRSGLGTTIVITEGNFVFTVGNNNYGQLGSGDQIEYHIPKRHKYTNVNTAWYY